MKKWNWDFIGVFLVLALFWFSVILWATGCTTRKHAQPCNQCPQYSYLEEIEDYERCIKIRDKQYKDE